MAVKTYVPTLKFWLHFGHKYATRWQSKLEASLSATCYSKLLTWISATADLINCIISE